MWKEEMAARTARGGETAERRKAMWRGRVELVQVALRTPGTRVMQLR